MGPCVELSHQWHSAPESIICSSPVTYVILNRQIREREATLRSKVNNLHEEWQSLSEIP